MRLPMRSSPPVLTRSGSMPARRGWRGCRRRRTATCRRSTHARVYRLKQRLPDVFVGINGGIATLDEAEEPSRAMSTASCSAVPPITRRRSLPMSTGASTALESGPTPHEAVVRDAALYRRRTCPRHAPAADHPPHARSLPWRARCALAGAAFSPSARSGRVPASRSCKRRSQPSRPPQHATEAAIYAQPGGEPRLGLSAPAGRRRWRSRTAELRKLMPSRLSWSECPAARPAP